MKLMPYEQLDQWKRGLDKLFDIPFGFNQEFGSHRIDVYETNTDVHASVEIPGLEKKEDVQIDINENVLTISGSVNRTKAVKEDQIHRSERFIGRFQRTVTLPDRVSAEGVRASYKNGILDIQMPKTKSETRQRIEVEFH
ncbi:MAG TPA: Hsp20/alpha crystallin family protein [Bacilli bacterium]